MLSAVYVQSPDVLTVKVPYPLEPVALDCATKEDSPESVSEIEREPEVEISSVTTEVSSVTEPVDVPVIVGTSLVPLMVTVTVSLSFSGVLSSSVAVTV